MMKIQKISSQNFGVTILSDKINQAFLRERNLIGNFWGIYSPQYDYLYQMQQEIDDLYANGILDLREGKNKFSLILLRQNDSRPKVKTFKNSLLNTKVILDFLKSIK